MMINDKKEIHKIMFLFHHVTVETTVSLCKQLGKSNIDTAVMGRKTKSHIADFAQMSTTQRGHSHQGL